MAGRPSIRNPETDMKIFAGAQAGCTLAEIAFMAGIHRVTLDRWMNEDPELKYEVERLREEPAMKARKIVVDKLNLDDPINGRDLETAKWYLERKRKGEFSTRLETTGKDGNALHPTEETIKKANAAIDSFLKAHAPTRDTQQQ